MVLTNVYPQISAHPCNPANPFQPLQILHLPLLSLPPSIGPYLPSSLLQHPTPCRDLIYSLLFFFFSCCFDVTPSFLSQFNIHRNRLQTHTAVCRRPLHLPNDHSTRQQAGYHAHQVCQGWQVQRIPSPPLELLEVGTPNLLPLHNPTRPPPPSPRFVSLPNPSMHACRGPMAAYLNRQRISTYLNRSSWQRISTALLGRTLTPLLLIFFVLVKDEREHAEHAPQGHAKGGASIRRNAAARERHLPACMTVSS